MQGQATSYCSVRKVQDFLRLGALSDSTNPTIQEVLDLINQKEDIIDHRTAHAWRLRYSETNSGHDQTANYEYHDIDMLYEYQTGRPVYLKHRKVREIDSDSGDTLEIWDGSDWVDWLDQRTEGRDEDYWFDYEMGILFIKGRWGVVGPAKLRIKYRYGEDFVNKIVEDICKKMVAIDLFLGESRNAFIPEGGSASMSYGNRISVMQKQIEDQINLVKEMQIPTLAR